MLSRPGPTRPPAPAMAWHLRHCDVLRRRKTASPRPRVAFASDLGQHLRGPLGGRPGFEGRSSRRIGPGPRSSAASGRPESEATRAPSLATSGGKVLPSSAAARPAAPPLRSTNASNRPTASVASFASARAATARTAASLGSIATSAAAASRRRPGGCGGLASEASASREPPPRTTPGRRSRRLRAASGPPSIGPGLTDLAPERLDLPEPHRGQGGGPGGGSAESSNRADPGQVAGMGRPCGAWPPGPGRRGARRGGFGGGVAMARSRIRRQFGGDRPGWRSRPARGPRRPAATLPALRASTRGWTIRRRARRP